MSSKRPRGKKNLMVGYVVSDKNDKSIVVRCETMIQHPLYKKYIRRRKKFMAHDPENSCRIGDKVQIIEHRPMSRKKKWCLKKVLEKAA